MESCLDFIRDKMLEAAADVDDGTPNRSAVSKVIKATGGGAHKYFDIIAEKLDVRLVKTSWFPDGLLSHCPLDVCF